MTKPPHDVRDLRGDEQQLRAAHTLFRSCLHTPPASDDDWPTVYASTDRATALGAYDDSGMIGTLTANASVLALPGGKTVPMDAVSRVGVRADRTRRGVLSAVMRTYLRGTSAPIATLRATEGSIYRRFGYGVATRTRTVQVDARARLHDRAPVAGDVRLVQDQDEVRRLLPELLERLGTVRPGGIVMPAGFWQLVLKREGYLRLAVHEDGVACFKVEEIKGGEHYSYAMEVGLLFAATPTATATLLKFLLGVDLVRRIEFVSRPLDEEFELLLADPRAVRTTEIEDETWLRLVDVPAALAARTYGPGEPVVIEVVDDLLPANSGRYLVGPDGAERTDRDPQLRLGVADLGAVYLGDRPPSRLAAAGLVEVFDEAAPAAADRLFRLAEAPWCGTYF